MGKRKTYSKTDLSTPMVQHTRDASGKVVIPDDAVPPASTIIHFPRHPGHRRTMDFAPWYGAGIDPITFACQRQIERFLAKQDADVEVSSITKYCDVGLRYFLEYLVLRACALRRSLSLDDIDGDAISGYLGFLRDRLPAATSQRGAYCAAKAVLVALGKRGLIRLVERGDNATFPDNPFPNNNRKYKGEKPLPKAQRKAFTAAVKTAVMPLLNEDINPTSELLAYALLVVALHTGRNTTPLIEMPVDCLRSHPKDGTMFLTLYKRRGHSTNKVALRSESIAERSIESTPVVRFTVVRLIRRVIELTGPLRDLAPDEIKDRVWLFRSQQLHSPHPISALTSNTLGRAIAKLVADYKLKDGNGEPLRINVSRLRKTFVNRIYEILDGDVVATAIAAGNTPQVTGQHYLRPGEHAQKNWKFMGNALVAELLSKTLGATERTPTGRCTDTKQGDYAPKKDGASCMSFLNCLRCRNYVVTGDDLYRLFSFYERVWAEKSRLSKRKWDQHYAHIPRLIYRDVIEPGIAKGVFKRDQVQNAHDRARRDPHPFWKGDSILGDLEALQ